MPRRIAFWPFATGNFPKSTQRAGIFRARCPASRVAKEAIISVEIELKLAAAASDLPKLRAALATMGSVSVETQLVSTYYDTADFALQREGTTLRVRKTGRRHVQTVKSADLADGAEAGRGEWEDPISRATPDLTARTSSRHLPPGIAPDDLHPVFSTHVARTTITLASHGETRIEAALDRGEIRSTGATSEKISEIELELKAGDPAALYDLALRLIEVAPLRLTAASKSSRGYRLIQSRAKPPPAFHGKPVALDPAMTVDTFLQRIGRASLHQLLLNEPAALAREAEGIHQMRVAVRRLRSALSAFKPMLPAEHYRWANDELKWIGNALGAARNWDVFAASLVPPVSTALPLDRDLERLAGAKERLRQASYDAAIEEILSPRYTAALLRLMRWFEGRFWRDQPVSEQSAKLLAPISELAPVLLDQRLHRVAKRSRHFAKLGPPQRHKLRIALKQLRYTIEMLGSLFGGHSVKSYVKHLKPLQDALGDANDVKVAHTLVTELRSADASDERAIDRAGGLVLGWHEREMATQEDAVRKDLRQLKNAKPFWRK
ncbi:MAG: putative adenylate cyclase [Rhodospirillales bacterium]|nr:putative adenylate cyclase [Rhodospirillales bacterium]